MGTPLFPPCGILRLLLISPENHKNRAFPCSYDNAESLQMWLIKELVKVRHSWIPAFWILCIRSSKSYLLVRLNDLHDPSLIILNYFNKVSTV